MDELNYEADAVTIVADDETVTSRAGFMDRADDRIFYLTFTHPEYRGQNLAATVTEAALRRAVDDGKNVVAMCPYVVRWLSENPESGIPWREATDEERTWVQERVQ